MKVFGDILRHLLSNMHYSRYNFLSIKKEHGVVVVENDAKVSTKGDKFVGHRTDTGPCGSGALLQPMQDLVD